ncbi:DUF2860 family protein [Motiliproteus sediminis]|uniref:DUF2860 family protein n=1 Tax=Motiliproteus sediminis TaxID=1468178 RepID=UPI001AEFD1E6|nr:DUF2860 family protein [Motiliproteus sediminis]
MRILTVGIILATLTLPAQAEVIKIPDQSGFSGFLSAGVKYAELASNTVAGNKSDKLSRDVITSLDAPDSKDTGGVSFNFDLRYTLAEHRTQFFLGTLIQDALRFDFSTQLGVRREFGDKGIVAASYLFSTFPAEVYADPFLTGSPRQKSELDSSGVRLSWEDIMGSGFAASISARDQDLDSELSGQSVGGLTAAERRSLDRNGDLTTIELSYNWVIAKGQLLTPAIIHRSYDLDGDSVSRDGTLLQLTYAYRTQNYSFLTNLLVGQYDYDAGNPVFGGQKGDSDELGISATFFLHRLADIESLTGYASVAYFDSDSDIDFYDQDANTASVGVIWRFN